MTSDQAVVLVVEDDPGIREYYAAMLGDHWQFRGAAGEDEALGALDDSVSVALLDRDLGAGSGDAVLATIDQRSIDCLVAMVTGVPPDTDIVDMNVDDYLTKPVGPDRLRATVSELLVRSTYDERVREYLALTRKRALLEDEYGRAKLRESEAYETLCDRLAASAETAADVLEVLDELEKLAEREEGAELDESVELEGLDELAELTVLNRLHGYERLFCERVRSTVSP